MNVTANPHETLSMREAVEEINSLSRHLERLVILASEDEVEDLTEAIGMLQSLNGAKAATRDAHAAYEQIVAQAMENTYEVKLPDGNVATRSEGAPRKKWDHARLGNEVARRIIDTSVDMETGEMKLSTQEMIEHLLQFGAVSYWRVKQLNKLGINANNYCEFGDPTISVVIKKPKGK